jgi:hypothetical protein
MQYETDRDYHTRRAREELDRAYRADGWTALSAHFRLSSLHMQRVRERSGPAILARIAKRTAAGSERRTFEAGTATARAQPKAESHASA